MFGQNDQHCGWKIISSSMVIIFNLAQIVTSEERLLWNGGRQDILSVKLITQQ